MCVNSLPLVDSVSTSLNAPGINSIAVSGIPRHTVTTQAEHTTGRIYAWTFYPHGLFINMTVTLLLKWTS